MLLLNKFQPLLEDFDETIDWTEIEALDLKWAHIHLYVKELVLSH